MIDAIIMERLALGPDDGQGMKLVGVSGTGHAGRTTARRHVERTEHNCAEVLAVEYAGRAETGDQVYLVTWRVAS